MADTNNPTSDAMAQAKAQADELRREKIARIQHNAAALPAFDPNSPAVQAQATQALNGSGFTSFAQQHSVQEFQTNPDLLVQFAKTHAASAPTPAPAPPAPPHQPDAPAVYPTGVLEKLSASLPDGTPAISARAAATQNQMNAAVQANDGNPPPLTTSSALMMMNNHPEFTPHHVPDGTNVVPAAVKPTNAAPGKAVPDR